MPKKFTYVPCSKKDIPSGVRFDTPDRYRGQAIEVSFGGFDRGAHDEGDPYKLVTDHSAHGAETYYRLA
jgi:hypothetical protein